jgi:DNA-binding response OmpR family regulator
MSRLAITGDEPEIAATLALQVKTQLGIECVRDEEAGVPSLHLADKQLKMGGLVLKAPLRMQDILAEIEDFVHNPALREALILTGGVVFSFQQKQLSAGEQSVDLTEKETQLLQQLAASDDGLSRETLLKLVWGVEEALDTHTLETHIYRLRAKLRELTGSDDMIEAVAGGYRLKKD